jgi:hypothetical protein
MALIISQFMDATLAVTQPSSRSKIVQYKIADAIRKNAVLMRREFGSSRIADRTASEPRGHLTRELLVAAAS